MQLLFLIIYFIVFLFLFYLFAREDHIFYRRNVTLEIIFDISFVGFVLVVLTSRLAYVVLHPTWAYLNPLVLFLFPYFPGLSLAGGILGGVFYGIYVSHRKKIPTGRLLDIVSLSFLFTLAFGVFVQVGIGFLLHSHTLLLLGISGCLFLLSFIIFTLLFLKSAWKDGKVSLGVLLLVSILSIAETILGNLHTNIFLLTENYLFLVIIFLSIMLLLNDLGKKG